MGTASERGELLEIPPHIGFAGGRHLSGNMLQPGESRETLSAFDRGALASHDFKIRACLETAACAVRSFEVSSGATEPP